MRNFQSLKSTKCELKSEVNTKQTFPVITISLSPGPVVKAGDS